VVHWTLFGLVKDTVGIFVLLPLLFFVGPMAPYTRTVMSNTVSQSEQAKIFSAFSALEGIAALLAPLYSAGYTVFVQAGMAGMIFEVMAIATAVGLVIVTYVRYTPALAKHIPEDHHPRFAVEDLTVGAEVVAGLVSEGDTTLQYRHLSRTSMDEGPVGGPGSVDRGGRAAGGLTARLLAESPGEDIM
jgi:hypothetical protein